MLVFDQFDGDDTALAWRQRDVTAAALALIVATGEQHYRNACRIAGQVAEDWPEPGALHALQPAHDVLAAAWRWEVSPPAHPRLGFDPAPRAVDAADWLRWLAAELRGWHDDPELILSTLALLRETDPDAGRRMAHVLRDRHASVPWHEE